MSLQPTGTPTTSKRAVALRQISSYRNAASPTPNASHSVGFTLGAIGAPSPALVALLKKVRSEPDDKKRQALKRSLPAHTFSGVFTRRNYKGCTSYTGLMVIDIDDVGAERVPALRAAAGELPYVLAVWRSPSGNGLKVLVRQNGDFANHVRAYKAAAKALGTTLGVPTNMDTSACDPTRLCYDSYDPDIHFKGDLEDCTPAPGTTPDPFGLDEEDVVVEDDEAIMTAAAARLPDVTITVATDALKYLDPFTERADWLRVLAAIKAQFAGTEEEQEAEELAERWSQGKLNKTKWKPSSRSNYDAEGFSHAYKSLKRSRAGGTDITFRTVLRLATDAGWVPGRQHNTQAPAEVVALVEEHGDYNKKLGLMPSLRTLDAIWQHDEALKALLRMNSRTQSVEYSRDVPWHAVDRLRLRDTDIIGINSWLTQRYACPAFPKDLLRDKLEHEAARSSFDPVAEYLERLPEWDGLPRIDDALSRYFRAEDSEWLPVISRRWFIGSVARGLRPGVKFDHMLILTGVQGLGKSTGFNTLFGGRDDFFSNADLDFRKDAKEWLPILCRAWCHESAEMGSLTKVDADRIKHVITANGMDAILKYDKYATKFQYGFVMVATTNEQHVLRDSTGNRRFWVVKCRPEPVPVAKLAQARDQLWAEALAAYRSGERWWVDGMGKDKGLAGQLEAAARGHHMTQDDPWYGLLKPVVDGLQEFKANLLTERVEIKDCDRPAARKLVAADVYAVLGIRGIQGDMRAALRLRGVLAALGFDPQQQVMRATDATGHNGTHRGWVRVTKP